MIKSPPNPACPDRHMDPSEVRFHLHAIARLSLELADLVAPEPVIGFDCEGHEAFYDLERVERVMTPERFARAARVRDSLQVHIADVLHGVGADQLL